MKPISKNGESIIVQLSLSSICDSFETSNLQISKTKSVEDEEMDDEERDDEEASGLDKYKLDAAAKLEEEEVRFY